MRTGIILIVVALSLPAAAADRSIEKGRQLFETVGCYQCHGYVGQGGSAGLRLAPDPLPLEALVQFVRETKGAMPSYSADVLSDADLGAIYAFLKSVPQSRKVDEIPLLRSLR